MIHRYDAPTLARCRARAIREGIKLQETPVPLHYRATSSTTPRGAFVYDQQVSSDLCSASCTCVATTHCDHAGAAICAARLAALRLAARTRRRGQLWAKAMAAAAADAEKEG